MPTLKSIWTFTKDMINAYIEDDGFTKGAALAYYTTFSLAPIVIVVIALAGLVFGEEAVRGEVYAQLDGLLGAEAAASIQDLVEASYNSGDTLIATIIGVGTLLFGATGAFNQLKISLDAIWGIESKPKNGIIGFLKARATAFAMVVGLGFILLVSLVVNALAVGMSNLIGEYFSTAGEITLTVVSTVISIALTGGIFAIIFKYLADVRVRWTEVLWGSLFTAILFSLGRFAIGFYIGNSSITSGFGAAGSLVALLVWTYYSSQIVFLGAEFIWVLARRNGHPVLPTEDAVLVVKQTKKLEAIEAARRAPLGAETSAEDVDAGKDATGSAHARRDGEAPRGKRPARIGLPQVEPKKIEPVREAYVHQARTTRLDGTSSTPAVSAETHTG